ncbi:hypothetical protein [Rhodovulum sulfidophilum]|uniref:hypothetical protein n=1 Tax=Rhodovulum sulfidophilum TaxID=35806 RepID=UPI0013896DBD|nr:hypothetical protein [Rhodovulum sulfidophilum]NDK34825.1 hypothetical protein [Rhodovulum sulfidophilum]
MQKVNAVVRISFAGGLIGLVFGSTGGKVDRILQGQNRMGWNMAEVIPAAPPHPRAAAFEPGRDTGALDDVQRLSLHHGKTALGIAAAPCETAAPKAPAPSQTTCQRRPA